MPPKSRASTVKKSTGSKRKRGEPQSDNYETLIDDDLVRPSPIFPSYNPAPPHPLSAIEKSQVEHALHIRDTMRRSAAYRPLPAKGGTAVMDPFRGMPRYSSRYTNTPPKSFIDGTFLPPELRRIIDPSFRTKAKPTVKARKDVLKTQTAAALENEEEDTGEGDDEDDGLGGEEDEFEDDEVGGDYDAEGYFDAGDDEGVGTWGRGFEDQGGEGSGYFE